MDYITWRNWFWHCTRCTCHPHVMLPTLPTYMLHRYDTLLSVCVCSLVSTQGWIMCIIKVSPQDPDFRWLDNNGILLDFILNSLLWSVLLSDIEAHEGGEKNFQIFLICHSNSDGLTMEKEAPCISLQLVTRCSF